MLKLINLIDQYSIHFTYLWSDNTSILSLSLDIVRSPKISIKLILISVKMLITNHPNKFNAIKSSLSKRNPLIIFKINNNLSISKPVTLKINNNLLPILNSLLKKLILFHLHILTLKSLKIMCFGKYTIEQIDKIQFKNKNLWKMT